MYVDGKEIGKELKALRARSGLSGEDVAEKVGVHINSLYKYERDASKLNLDVFEKLLRVYNVDEVMFFRTVREFSNQNILQK